LIKNIFGEKNVFELKAVSTQAFLKENEQTKENCMKRNWGWFKELSSLPSSPVLFVPGTIQTIHSV
jgi:hypothetical protein